MCVVFPMCISVFPLYPNYRAYDLLVSFYATTLPIPLPIFILLLIFRSYPLVYSSLPLPLITCRTYHGVRCLYSYIDYLSLYIHLLQFLFLSIFLRPYSIATNFPSPFSSMALSSVFFPFLSICSWMYSVAYLTF